MSEITGDTARMTRSWNQHQGQPFLTLIHHLDGLPSEKPYGAFASHFRKLKLESLQMFNYSISCSTPCNKFLPAKDRYSVLCTWRVRIFLEIFLVHVAKLPSRKTFCYVKFSLQLYEYEVVPISPSHFLKSVLMLSIIILSKILKFTN